MFINACLLLYTILHTNIHKYFGSVSFLFLQTSLQEVGFFLISFRTKSNQAEVLLEIFSCFRFHSLLLADKTLVFSYLFHFIFHLLYIFFSLFHVCILISIFYMLNKENFCCISCSRIKFLSLIDKINIIQGSISLLQVG